MKRNVFGQGLKFLLFLSIGLAILYFVYQNQEAAFQAECACKGTCEEGYGLLDKIWADFKTVKVFWVLMVILAFMLSNLARALRWNMLIEPLGYKTRTFNTFFSTMIGYLVNLALPRAGEIAKPATLARYEKVPMDKLLGTIVVDRVFDVIMLLLIVGLTFLVQFQHLWNFLFGKKAPPSTCVEAAPVAEAGPGIAWVPVLIAVASVFLLLLVIAYFKRRYIRRSKAYHKFKGLLVNFKEGILSVFKLKRPLLFIFYTVSIWVLYFLMLYLCFFAFEPTSNLPAKAALLTFLFGTFGIVIPSPGGMGTYQLAVMMALIIYQVPEAEAFSFANIIFFTITFCNIFFGFLGYILMPIYNRSYEPEQPASSKTAVKSSAKI